MTHFGVLLRRLRISAELSQEALAEAASISTAAVGAYERGLRAAPHRETVAELAKVLGLDEAQRVEFESAARRKRRSPGALAVPTGAVVGEPNRFALDNLPLETTSFVGRAIELEEIGKLLSEHRIVTLTGMGGIGKTRIALNVASRLRGTRRDGVWFIGFGTLSDWALVVPTVAAALGLATPTASDNPAEAFAAALKDRHMVLIFDNCEHLAAAIGSLVAAIARTCQGVTILATGRERLNVSGEVAYRVPPLCVPPLGATTTVAALSFTAVELFVQRLTSVDGGFELSDARMSAIGAICRRVDGIPLALELAAARVPALGLNALRVQLDRHFSILSGGNRDLPDRHQTMHGAMSWSYALLDDHERLLFRRVGVFAGGWTLEAAEHAFADVPREQAAAIDVLSSLVEKSLIAVSFSAETPRYDMLQVTRSFAREKAAELGESESNARRHAVWAATVAAEADASYFSTPRRDWLEFFGPETENVRFALEWTLERGNDPFLAANIVSDFFEVSYVSGFVSEFRKHGTAALASIDQRRYPHLAGRLYSVVAHTSSGDEGIAAGERAIELLMSEKDYVRAARCWAALADRLLASGHLEFAEKAIDRTVALYAEHGINRSLAAAHAILANIMYRTGRIEDAHSRYLIAVSAADGVSDDWLLSSINAELAEFEFLKADASAAFRRANDALAASRRADTRRNEMFIVCNRACYRLALSDITGALNDAVYALRLTQLRHPQVAIVAIQHLATVATLRNDCVRGARLLGFVNRNMGAFREPTEEVGYRLLMASLRLQCSDEEIAVFGREGEALAFHVAVDEALDVGI